MRPAGLSDGETEHNAPVNADAILQSILGRGSERFGMVAAVLRGERIIARVPQGFEREGPQNASHSIINFTLVPALKP